MSSIEQKIDELLQRERRSTFWQTILIGLVLTLVTNLWSQYLYNNIARSNLPFAFVLFLMTIFVAVIAWKHANPDR